MDYREIILNQSTAVRTKVLAEVNTICKSVSVDFEGVISYSTSVIEWLKPIIDLSDFNVYPMNGITEGLNWWYANEERSVKVLSGDYQWLDNKNGIQDTILYLSCPSAIDGNYINIPNDIPVALDLAYVGSTKIKNIKVTDNIQYVFYSLSKSFGIRNIRTGWYFTRKKDERLENLSYGAKYYNYYARDVSEEIFKNFSVEYIHGVLSKQQNKICDILSLNPSDSVWLSTTTNDLYKKLNRKNNLNRLCLSGVYDYEFKKT